jgi:hypothetical protein
MKRELQGKSINSSLAGEQYYVYCVEILYRNL